MRIEQVQSGVDFEQFIINGLIDMGIVVYDTPASSDYGADVVFDYKGHRFVGQCKYYTGRVGVKAVQEVVGAREYYQAQYCIVFTNSLLTQQARNLADVHHVLILDGPALENLICYENGDVPAFDQMLTTGAPRVAAPAPRDWVMNDLVGRYGMSSQKIIKDCISRGLPYEKVGREYHFDPDAVKRWEISQQRIPSGRNGQYELPAFTSYREHLLHEYYKAKREKRRDDKRAIRAKLRKHNIPLPGAKPLYFALLICLFLAMLIVIFAFDSKSSAALVSSLFPLLFLGVVYSLFYKLKKRMKK